MVEIRDTSSRGHTLPGDLCQWFAALNPALAFSMIWRGIRGRTLPVAAADHSTSPTSTSPTFVGDTNKEGLAENSKVRCEPF
jgi:hypothetical protein